MQCFYQNSTLYTHCTIPELWRPCPRLASEKSGSISHCSRLNSHRTSPTDRVLVLVPPWKYRGTSPRASLSAKRYEPHSYSLHRPEGVPTYGSDNVTYGITRSHRTRTRQKQCRTGCRRSHSNPSRRPKVLPSRNDPSLSRSMV